MRIIIPPGGAVRLINSTDEPITVQAKGVDLDLNQKAIEIRPNGKSSDEVIYVK